VDVSPLHGILDRLPIFEYLCTINRVFDCAHSKDL
jgi:hypothetical protein